MKKYYYAISVMTKDRTGIVANTTKVLFDNGFNLADSSSTLLQGVFSMILLVSHDKQYQTSYIKDLFNSADTTVAVYEIDKITNGTDDHDIFIISVYGADKPGIVHAVTSTLAGYKINITDLQTKVTGKQPNEVYIMILEAMLPLNADLSWIDALKAVSLSLGVDVNVRKLESYEL